MDEEMECMCMECGVSNYLAADMVIMDDQEGTNSKLLSSLLVCPNCGGQLKLIGKAGDEPYYRLS
jgi:Zn finger protein HypA/HybF involved in hydrogenase expression